MLRGKLKSLLAWIQEQVPGTRGRAVIDTAPLLERDFARRAGLGWFGKNTMLIDKKLGSYFLLGALLLDLELPADEPFATAHCGSCTRCLDACPTDAFVGPYQLDARRCISYLTIELRGTITDELRTMMGDWIFGCDVCQEVCPWNRKAPAGASERFRPMAPICTSICLSCCASARRNSGRVMGTRRSGGRGGLVCCEMPRLHWGTPGTRGAADLAAGVGGCRAGGAGDGGMGAGADCRARRIMKRRIRACR